MRNRGLLLVLGLCLAAALLSAAGCGKPAPKENAIELYPVCSFGLYGYADKTGKTAIPPQYQFASKFREELAAVESHGRTGYIDRIGKLVIPFNSQYGLDFSNGLALVYREGRYVYIDKTGRTVINAAIFDSAGSFSEGLAPVSINGKFGYIDKKSKTAIAPRFYGAGSFKEGLAPVQSGGRRGYIDTKGRLVIPARYREAREFSEGLAAVKEKDLYGYLDLKGNTAVKPGFREARDFHEGLAAVKTPLGQWGYIDYKGRMKVNAVYSEASDFSGGYAAVKKGREYLVIDKQGRVLSRYREPLTVEVDNGLVRVNSDQRISLRTPGGRLIYRPNTPLELDSGLGLVEKKYKNGSLTVYYPFIEGFSDAKLAAKVNSAVRELFPLDYQPDAGETVFADYTVNMHRGNILALTAEDYSYHEGAAHGITYRRSAVINLKNGKVYGLKDLFKKDSGYMQMLNQRIEKDFTYWEYGQIVPFTGLTGDDQFYLEDDGLVIYFQLYQYTAYAYGFPEFKIPYSELDPFIDKEGELWQALKGPEQPESGGKK